MKISKVIEGKMGYLKLIFFFHSLWEKFARRMRNDDDEVIWLLLRNNELIVNLLDPVGSVFIAKLEKSQHANVES